MSENYETKLIGIQNGRNFRELGGYKTVSGQTIKYNKWDNQNLWHPYFTWRYAISWTYLKICYY